LERFTSGGWAKGLLRLGLGVAVVVAVVHFFARDALALLLDRDVTAVIALGAAAHLLQRTARVLKWARIIEPAGLIPRRWTYLLRVQLIGLVANLLLPVSDALKVWAVSRDRRDVVVGSESIVVDVAMHTSMLGALGLMGVLATDQDHWLPWVAAVALTLVPALILLLLERTRGGLRTVRIIDGRALAWCAVETTLQLATYVLAVGAIGIDVQPLQLLALAPLLFLSDMVMLTPQGLGLREALFAVVLHTLSTTPSEASVAVALVITTMLFVASTIGGALGLLLPTER